MGRPPTKEYKRLGLKKTAEDFDEDLEEIVSSDDVEEEEVEEEEEPPPPVARKSSKAPARRLPAKKVEEPDDDLEEITASDDDVDDTEDENIEEEPEEEYDDEEQFEDEEPVKAGGPSWLTILVLIAIGGFFAAFINLPVLFFQNNPALGAAAVVAIVAAVFMYFRTEAEKRDSFFLSGPGLVTLGALLCLWLGGLSEYNKEKQRLADEADAARMQKDKDASAAAAKPNPDADAPLIIPPSRPGTEAVSVGKWTITQDERGAYRVNGKKITGTWKLKDDQERIQFLSEEEKSEIRDALNKFDDQNQKK